MCQSFIEINSFQLIKLAEECIKRINLSCAKKKKIIFDREKSLIHTRYILAKNKHNKSFWTKLFKIKFNLTLPTDQEITDYFNGNYHNLWWTTMINSQLNYTFIDKRMDNTKILAAKLICAAKTSSKIFISIDDLDKIS